MSNEQIDLNDYDLGPFDICEAIEGFMVVTTQGYIPKDLHIIVGRAYPVRATIFGDDLLFTMEGKRSTSGITDPFDLRIAVKRTKVFRERWIFLCDETGFETEEEAREAMRCVSRDLQDPRRKIYALKKVQFEL